MRARVSISVMALLLAGTTLAGAQNPTQAQPQLDTPQKQDLPIDHEKERAKQNSGQTQINGADADPDKGRGRTPETGQAMGMPPSPPDSADATANLPGVSPQTLPAKFSADVARKDAIKTTERPLSLTEQQKSLILQRLAESKNTPNVSAPGLYAEPGTVIPTDISGQDIPPELQANVPGLKGLKYVKKDQQVLLIMPANGIVRNVLQ